MRRVAFLKNHGFEGSGRPQTQRSLGGKRNKTKKKPLRERCRELHSNSPADAAIHAASNLSRLCGGRLVKSLLRRLSVCALALVFAIPASAEDKKKPDEVKKPAPFAGVFAFPKTVTLTEDQQRKLDELRKDYTPKLEELKKKSDSILTADRLTAQKEALAKAKAEGKKGKELNDAGTAALKLNEDEAKQLAETKAAQGKLMAEINKKKMELLTDEQKKALQPKPKTDK
jgi:hypothetical protein